MINSIEFLNALAHNLRHQDNLYTRQPIYDVQEHKLITGIDTDYTDQIGWFDTDGGSQADDEEAAEMEAKYDETMDVPEGWVRTGYDYRWEQVASFFTQKAAEKYMATNSHRHEGELRMYVSSAYRNPEWAELRRLLSGPLLDCLFALQDVTEELRQLHAHHYASCEGGCPANSYIERAKEALANLDTYKDPYA